MPPVRACDTRRRNGPHRSSGRAAALAGVLFALGYAMQAGIINPFITRPEYSQFILLVAVAIIITNVLLIVFGPDARNVQTSYSFDSFLVGPLIIDATKVYAGAATVVITAALAFRQAGQRPGQFGKSGLMAGVEHEGRSSRP